jgi:anti-sigma B factor antagonist
LVEEGMVFMSIFCFSVNCSNYPVKFMTLTQECQMVLFKPQGSIDLQGGMALSEKMAGVVPQRHQLWVIDLAEVDFMDSSGLVPLVKGLKAARQSGCRLVLCNVKAPVRLILELTQLDSVFEIFNTYEEILIAVNESSLKLAG